jgi:hypothetical protein
MRLRLTPCSDRSGCFAVGGVEPFNADRVTSWIVGYSTVGRQKGIGEVLTALRRSERYLSLPAATSLHARLIVITLLTSTGWRIGCTINVWLQHRNNGVPMKNTILCLILASAGQIFSQPNPYRGNDQWAQLPAGRKLGSASAIDIDRRTGNIWVADRCGANSCSGSTLNPIFEARLGEEPGPRLGTNRRPSSTAPRSLTP